MGKYNISYLVEYSKNNNIILLENYDNKTIDRETIIKAKCLNIDCSNIVFKKFRNIVENTGCFCKNCTNINKILKTRLTNLKVRGVINVFQCPEVKKKSILTNIEKYGVDNPNKCREVRNKIENTNLEIYGFKNPNQSSEVRDKTKKTNMAKRGVSCSLLCPNIKDKIANTNLKIYGFENPLKSPEIREKIKKTNIDRYSYENPGQVPEIKEKIKKYNIDKYQVEYTFQANEVKEKIIETNLKRYGVKNPLQCRDIKNKQETTLYYNYSVTNPSQSIEIQNKKILTSNERYGTDYPCQNPEIADKCSINSYKIKKYKFPSGKEVKVQGYEPFALDELVKNFNENNIVVGCCNVPKIKYLDENGKQHIHFVDIFIPSLNRCIEVKSTWTMEKKKDCVFLKQKSAKNLGYEYFIWVYDKKGNKVEKYE